VVPGFDYCAHQSPENLTAMRAIIEFCRATAGFAVFVGVGVVVQQAKRLEFSSK
jgi:hypothetical protein